MTRRFSPCFSPHTKRCPLIAKAVDAATKGTDDLRNERQRQLAAVASEIAKCAAAVERYLFAFENGTMLEARCAERVNQRMPCP